MTHNGIYTLPFILQLYYKSLCILQRVSKHQKVHISSHDVLQKITSTLLNIGLRFSQRGGREAGISSFPLFPGI